MYTCCILYSITVTAASAGVPSPDTLEFKSQSDAMYY